ncbi:MAG: ABC transporter permease [Eubacterium sp.]|nr:ABC transporter permease [Eubacterium sp.]
MNTIKRVCLYLIRKKVRTLLLLSVLFLMSLTVLVGFFLKGSTERELERLRLSMASGFVLKVDTDNEMYWEKTDFGNGASADHYAGPMITDAMVEKICSLDGVEDYVVSGEAHMAWTDITLRPGMNAAIEPDPNPDPDELIPFTEEYLKMCCHSTDVYSCRNGERHKNFRTGAFSITDGRNLEEEDRFKAVVSDWLAKENGLSVGDSLTLETKEGNYDFTKEPLKTWGEPVEVEIVGLFHANFSQPTSDMTLEQCYVENIIYADRDTYIRLQDNLKGHARYEDVGEDYDKHMEVEFLVSDPGQVDAIMEQVRNLEGINMENMELEADSSAYEASAGPYRQVRDFSLLLLVLGLCGMGIVLYLLGRLWMQGRRREIGILRSVGIGRKEILGQMLAESFVVSLAALALAVLLSGPAAGKCADAAERLAAPKEGKEAYVVKVDQYFMPQIAKTSSDEVLLDGAVSSSTIGFAALFVCGISGISVLLSFAKISGMGIRELLQSE